MITFHAYYHRKTARWRFLLNHAGLWLALFAGFFGSSDTRTLRIPLYKGEPAREAFDMNGVSYHLDYEMELRSFSVEYYPNGSPSRFAAEVRLGDDEALLEVNHPYSYRLGEDVYLTSYDMASGNESKYCVLQVVIQPWKYIMVASILMMLAGAVLLFINGPKKCVNLEKGMINWDNFYVFATLSVGLWLAGAVFALRSSTRSRMAVGFTIAGIMVLGYFYCRIMGIPATPTFADNGRNAFMVFILHGNSRTSDIYTMEVSLDIVVFYFIVYCICRD